jgi:mercuric reductase
MEHESRFTGSVPGGTSGTAGNDPDLFIIGAGSAAFAAAIAGAGAGARVLMVGDGMIGGTCVNVGCVPSKALIRAVQAVHDGRSALRFDGVKAEAGVLDWKALVRQKQALVGHLRKAKYRDLLSAYANIAYVTARAQFTGHGMEIEVDGASYRPRKVIVATGASPTLPPIPGLDGVPVLDSTKALELESLPRTLLIIGGGIIGCEMGQLFARAGVQVTICYRSRLLPAAEPEVSQALAGYFAREGVNLCQGVGYQQIVETAAGIALTCQTKTGERLIAAERVLVATGRRPNTAGLGLERIGVAVDGKGGIPVNEFMQTTRPDVYAAGDATGRDMFVYMAAYGGRIAAENALDGNRRRYDNTAMPAVVFTDPQAASCGLTESAARARGYDVVASVLPLEDVPRYLVSRNTHGLIKLVADRCTDKLLGASILAPEAGDSIQTAVLAIKGEMTVETLADTIFPYLTGVEGVKLAALAFRRDVKKLSCCAS